MTLKTFGNQYLRPGAWTTGHLEKKIDLYAKNEEFTCDESCYIRSFPYAAGDP